MRLTSKLIFDEKNIFFLAAYILPSKCDYAVDAGCFWQHASICTAQRGFYCTCVDRNIHRHEPGSIDEQYSHRRQLQRELLLSMAKLSQWFHLDQHQRSDQPELQPGKSIIRDILPYAGHLFRRNCL